MTLEMLKERQKELKFTDEQMSILTNTPKSTFHRRWHGDGQNLPHDFVARCCLVLGLSIDEDQRRPTENSTANLQIGEDAHEETMRIIAERLNWKNEQLEILNDRVETLRRELDQKNKQIAELHESHDERIKDKNDLIAELKSNTEKIQERADRQIEDMRRRMDRKNKIILIQFVAMLCVTVFALYWVVDSFNGDWGFVQYERLLELLPDHIVSPTTEYSVPDIADDIVGLWMK